MSAPESLLVELDQLLATAQAEQRLPSVAACAFRDGETIWERAIGIADVDSGETATTAHAYRIGSITKTFTAACVMQLREEGLVDLDAPLRAYVPEIPAGPTVRQALAHASGLQREPPGEIWETMEPPTREELLAGLEDAELVLVPGRRWHYSNLAFALLGELVVRLDDEPFETILRRRLLDPLGLDRTRLLPEAPAAKGYYVTPFSGRALPEPDLAVTETTSAAGWLWSTVGDLATWGDVLATGRPGVLDRAVVDEMASVQAMADEGAWTVAWGLGLGLVRRGERIFCGHGGAMPGFLAALVVNRSERTGAAVLTSTSASAAPETLAIALAEAVVDGLKRTPPPWSPAREIPTDVEPLLGRWWTEGEEIVLDWHDGRLRADLPSARPWQRYSVFEPDGDDRWRCVEGREQGELLRAVRDEAGAAVKLYFATYPLTRESQTFGE